MQFAEGHTVGIDLGTSYSAIAHLTDEGMPQVLHNSAGKPVTASIIALGPQGTVRIGDIGLGTDIDPANMVTAIKRQMGNRDFFVKHENRRLTPEFLSALVLRKLKQDAERRIGPISNAVITVPYYFNDPCRRATMDAGQIAGLNVVDVINEPTAATLAYAWLNGELGRRDAQAREKTILLYDLGGGTFDVTVVRYTPTRFVVLATDGDTFLGGLDWTNRLVDYVCDEMKRRNAVDPREDPQARLRVTQQCERAKRRLSRDAEVSVRISFAGQDCPVTISRRRFEELTADLLQRTRDTTELVLEDCGVAPSSLDEILLVGGSTHMPAVQEMFRIICGRLPSRQLDPRLAVAQGAAIHAAILEARETHGTSRLGQAILGRLQSVVAVDVNSHSLGVEVVDRARHTRRNHIMIPRNTRLPVEVQQRFVTSHNNPEGIRIRLLEGEAEEVPACTFVGDFRIDKLPPNLPAGSPVELTYRYDQRRRISVMARELTGNNSASVQLVWESGMQPGALELFSHLAQSYEVD